MRLPRDLGGEELAALLGRYGYEATRQTGSHMRLTTTGIARDIVASSDHISLTLVALHGWRHGARSRALGAIAERMVGGTLIAAFPRSYAATRQQWC